MSKGIGFVSSSCFLLYGKNVLEVEEVIREIVGTTKRQYIRIDIDPWKTVLVKITIKNPDQRINPAKLNTFEKFFLGNESNKAFIRRTEDGFEVYLLLAKKQRNREKDEAIKKALACVDMSSTRGSLNSESFETPWCVKIIMLSKDMSLDEKLRIAGDLANNSVQVAVMP